jgi:hypothetical protein
MAYKCLIICHRVRKNLNSDREGFKLALNNNLQARSFYHVTENFNIVAYLFYAGTVELQRPQGARTTGQLQFVSARC